MLKKINSKTLYLYSFSLFIIAALYGLLIRWNFTFPITSFPYKNVLQSHSHVAFLGWGYLTVIAIILKLFVPNVEKNKPIYKVLFFICSLAVFLMLFSFPLGGYKVFSIVLLSVFGIATYVISYLILKDLNINCIASKLIKFGVYYYLLSSLATWFVAVVMVTQGKTDLYYNTIYFYLHFLYNGFFVFALFGILFKILENHKVAISKKLQNGFFIYLNVSCIPAYTLSTLWSNVNSTYYVIGFAASVLQLVSLVYLVAIVKQIFKKIKWNYILTTLLKFGLIAYALKVIIQFFSSFPYFVEKSLALKPYLIIGYLHLFTLAFMSVILLLFLIKLNGFSIKNIVSKLGIGIFLFSIFITELLFFMQGFLLLLRYGLIPNYNLLLLTFSCLLVIGLVLIFINQFQNKYLFKN
jgi:hypothetical protein